MRSYHRLTEGERNQVYALKKAGLTQCAIAEQINGHLKDNDQPSVSPEWIYQYIYTDKRSGGDLHTHLRCQKQRRKRYGSIERRGQIKNKVSIEKRPEVVDLRNRVGGLASRYRDRQTRALSPCDAC